MPPQAGYAQNPNLLLKQMQQPMSFNWNDPGSMMSAISGMTPDIRQGYSSGTSSQFHPFGGGGGGSGFDQAVSGGGGRGYNMDSSSNQSGEWGTSGQAAKIGALGSAIPAAFQQQRYNRSMAALGSGNYSGFGGQSTAAPPITVGPIWTQSQIAQQVNANQAQNNARAQSQGTTTGQRVAGQGFGSRSPLLAALTGGQQANAAMLNATAAREIPWTAAEGNAKQVLASETARRDAWNMAMNQEIERKKIEAGLRSSWQSAVSGMV